MLSVIKQTTAGAQTLPVSKARFVELIGQLHETPSPIMIPPLFIFRLCPSAAEYNAKILAEHRFDLHRIISNQHPSQLSYGSEFRHPDLLKELLQQHPFWERLNDILLNGASFPLSEISQDDRKQDLVFHSDRGNHKSAILNKDKLREMIKEDVERGFSLPLPITALHFIPNASLAPLGCVKQSSIDMLGNRVVKYRMTHDQSFPGPSSLSVNLRVQHEKLPPIRYSFVLMRTIHYILDVRRRHPSVKIYLCKFDIDSAYRRCTLSSGTAFESMTVFEDFLFIALRMTFGGAPNPALWSVISETTTDVGNALLVNNKWDHHSIFDQISDQLDPPLSLPENIHFHQARDISVNIPSSDAGKIDIFIDDSIGVAPDIGDVPSRVIRAIPLAIRTLSRPESCQDIIPRKDIISIKKFHAEGRLEEVKTILGWVVNTRSLSISLPDHKLHSWITDIDSIISKKKSSFQVLETLLGRLNHVACIFMPMRHFMGRLYKALYRAKSKLSWTTLSTLEIEDLALHKEFLLYANRGISLNIIAFRKPTHIYRSDASEFGVGGYNVLTGRAWRWEIPTELRLRTSINSLEFMACVVTIWLDIIHHEVQYEDCLLSQTDNSTAAGWLRKSNFADTSDEFIQLSIARKLANLVIDSQICIYSQWFPGDSNSISDSLSRDFNIESSNLCYMLSTAFPLQAPFGLKLHHLPNEIVLWMTSLLQSHQPTEQWSKVPLRSSFVRGSAFKAICRQLASAQIPFWTDSIGVNDTKSSALSGNTSEKVDLVLSLPSFSRLTQSKPPWIAWHRPSSWLSNPTQDSTLMASLHSFYNDNFEDIGQPIPEKFLR